MPTLTVSQPQNQPVISSGAGSLNFTSYNTFIIQSDAPTDIIFSINLPGSSNISFFEAPYYSNPLRNNYGNWVLQLTPGQVSTIKSPVTMGLPGSAATGFSMNCGAFSPQSWIFGLMLGTYNPSSLSDFSSFTLTQNANGSYTAAYSNSDGTTASLTIQLHQIVTP